MMRRGGLARLLRWATWVCVIVLAILSLTPGDEMTRTGAPSVLEHFGAYAGAAFIATLGYQRRVGHFQIAALLISYAGLLELAQLWVPGRHSKAVDFAFSASGVIAGMAIEWLWSRRAQARP
jgi:VanZ family protein